MKFILPKLPYAFDALEPFSDATTVEIHYSKHHQAYTDKLNTAFEAGGFEYKAIEDVLKNIDQYNTAVRNNGGGYFNHIFFWESLAPNPNKEKRLPNGKLADAITSKFGSFEAFQEQFSQKASTHFGAGWAWLVINKDGELEITDTHNQDCPLSLGHIPLLGIDVWEHAYYLKFQNRRPEWISSFFNIINWGKVAERFDIAKK